MTKSKTPLIKSPMDNETKASTQTKKSALATLESSLFQENVILTKQKELIEPVVPFKKPSSKSKTHNLGQPFLTAEQLKQAIVKPSASSHSHLKELIPLIVEMPVETVEEVVKENFTAEEVNELIQPTSLVNLVIGHDIFDSHIVTELKKHNVKKLLLLLDTDYTKKLKSYKKLIGSFKESGVEFVEYSNIQPELNKKLVWKVSKFALDNEVDTVFAFGSYPLIDFSKIVVIKLTKQGVYNLNKINTKYFTESPYKSFSLSTVVCPDLKVNASTSLKCNSFFKSNAFTNTISLFTSIDNSDTAFFYPEVLLEISKNKLFEVLHETYFRTMLNFFGNKNSQEVKNKIILDLKSLKFFLTKFHDEGKLSLMDIDQISIIIMKTVDGSTYIDDVNQWRWFSLECTLSLVANSSKSKGLALFAPNYFKYETQYCKKFKAKALELSLALFNCHTIDGLVLNLIKHNEQFGLPKVLFDIAQLKKLTPQLLLSLTKKASYFVVSYRSSKAIVHNLPIW